MSKGYKEQCLFDGATAMWSFDGDQFERSTFEMLSDHIIDEVDDSNPATIETESAGQPAFFLGVPSLVYLEQANQFAARFGGVSSSAPWPRSYMQVSHSAAFTFPNFGSFSIEFLMKKDDANAYRVASGAQYWGVVEPVMRKIGVFEIFTYQGYDAQRLLVVGPAGSHSIEFSSIVGGFTIATHVVLTWECTQTGPYEYSGLQKIYINNRLWDTLSQIYQDGSFPDTGSSSNWEIGGRSEIINRTVGNRNYTGSISDRCTAKLTLDQISVYDYALSHSEVANHFQKTNTYRECIILESPSNMWGCDDLGSSTGSSIVPSVGSRGGTIFGSYAKGMPGPTSIPQSVSVELGPNSILWMISLAAGGSFTPIINISGNYTFEFWFRSAAGNIGSLVNMHGITPDFDGWQVDINGEDGSLNLGTIQFTERRGVSVKAYGTYNDDQWHHFAIRRSGATVDLFLDGSQYDRTTAGLSSINAPGQLVFFGGPTANTYAGPGALCYIATYNYPLANAQIACRSLYSVSYEIKGLVTLMGNPTAATLRFYLSKTGALVQEVDSDPSTGYYRAVLDSNAEVDILVFDKYNKNVRYRAYGPVSPAGFDDFPISI